jgi:NarL family two-component system response regulator LiaR
VLCLAAEGLTSKDAGARLGISEKTVRVHLSNAAGKLGARNTTRALLVARELGILRPA